jgi:outer membrane murein-binding lipoprotein Lpp
MSDGIDNALDEIQRLNAEVRRLKLKVNEAREQTIAARRDADRYKVQLDALKLQRADEPSGLGSIFDSFFGGSS